MTEVPANFYIGMAKLRYDDPDIDILDDADTSPQGGAWVSALIWIEDPPDPPNS